MVSRVHRLGAVAVGYRGGREVRVTDGRVLGEMPIDLFGPVALPSACPTRSCRPRQPFALLNRSGPQHQRN